MVLFGDTGQLPSVGCGQVLLDIINAKLLPVVELTKNYRIESTKDPSLRALALAMDEYRQGTLRLVGGVGGSYHAEGTNGRFTVHIVKYSEFGAKFNAELDRRKQAGLSNDRDTLLAIARTNKIVNDLNKVGQEFAAETEWFYDDATGQKLYIYDRVRYKSQEYEWDGQVNRRVLANGEPGVVTSNENNVYSKEKALPRCDYPSYVLDYARTVHAAQGMGVSDVLIFLDKPYQAKSRQLLYTALTRCRERVQLFMTNESYAYWFESKLPDCDTRDTMLSLDPRMRSSTKRKRYTDPNGDLVGLVREPHCRCAQREAFAIKTFLEPRHRCTTCERMTHS